MPPTAAKPRVLLLADAARPEVAAVLDRVRATIEAHATLIDQLPIIGDPITEADGIDLAVAVGGDGTLISQVRRLTGAGIPLVGINCGRLGFLAEFDVDSFAQHAAMIFSGNPRIHEHVIAHASVIDAAGATSGGGVAANDCVISAGRPFSMISLNLSINNAPGPTLSGDGLIIATTIGSTAYNVSAGGPIVHPSIDAFIITPLAAHTLAFRPIVVPATCEIRIRIDRANKGTTLVFDGQMQIPLTTGCEVIVKRHEYIASFVLNPTTTYWRILQDKMGWAAPPTYRGETPRAAPPPPPE